MNFYHTIYAERMKKIRYRPFKVSDTSLLKLIGEGSFGNVHLASNSSDGAKLIVKQFPLLRFGDRTDSLREKFIGMVQKEIDLLKNLNHSSLVKYLGSIR